MTGLQIYTTDYEPREVYASADADGRERGPVEQAVRFDDRPLDLLVAFRGQDTRILCSFKARRGAATSRTEYFVADYVGGGPEPFRGLASALSSLHDEGWTLPYAGEPRWDAPFDLWRVQPSTSDGSGADRDQLIAGLESRDPGDDRVPMVVGVPDHHAALRTLRAVEAAGVECTVAVGTDGDPDSLPGVDLLLVPDGSEPLAPLSADAETVLGASAVETDEAATEQPTEPASEEGSDGSPAPTAAEVSGAGDADVSTGLGARLSVGAVVVILGFAAYSFVSVRPVHPISGLGAVGGLLGAAVALFAVERGVFGRPAGDGPESGSYLANPFRTAPSRSLVALAYGGFAGFVFPTVFRVGGAVLTGEQWVFGTVSAPSGAAVSVGVFAAGLLLVSLAIVAADRWRAGETPLTPAVFGWLLSGHLLYAGALVVATGLARPVWFGLIPSVSG